MAKAQIGEAHKKRDFPEIAKAKREGEEKKAEAEKGLAETSARADKLSKSVERCLFYQYCALWQEQTNCQLRTLVLNNCGLSSVHITRLRGVLLQQEDKSGQLESLSLDGNELCDRGADELATLVTKSKTLQTLSASNIMVTPVGFGSIVAGTIQQESR